MNLFGKQENIKLLKQYITTGIIVAIIWAIIEHLIQSDTDNPQVFIPLIVRANIAAFFIASSFALFEIFLKNWLKQKTFTTIVLTRSLSYTFLISFWLSIVNGFWFFINFDNTFLNGVWAYLSGEGYWINLLTVLLLSTFIISLRQIDSLHRKGELLDFILGKYHKPKEAEFIFCFVDLKGSTTIGEKLGHYQFGLFLKDYYSDITDAIRETDAGIYQYVGDEIILYWTYKNGLKNNNMLHCFFIMKNIIENLKPKYLDKYGVYPEFKAGLHGGKVTVTRVGEIKKEIVFLGDVLNTTARIQEDCKRLSKEFLISGKLLENVKDLGKIKASFAEETILRGKSKTVKLYSLELGSLK